MVPTLGVKEKKRIIIAEDHRILREGLRVLLSANSEFKIVAEAQDGLEAIQCIERYKPDMALVDLSMPRMNGTDAIREIKRTNPDIKLLVLTVHRAEEYVLEALQAGADGYVLKDATSEELTMAIQSVLNGEPYLSPGVSKHIIEGYLTTKTAPKLSPLHNILTQREREILKLVAEGNKNKQIAAYLCISLKTVETHRTNLMKKLDLHNTAELTAFAIQNGMVENR